MCIACGVPTSIHEEVVMPAVNSAFMLSPWFASKWQMLARAPQKLVELFVDAILRI